MSEEPHTSTISLHNQQLPNHALTLHCNKPTPHPHIACPLPTSIDLRCSTQICYIITPDSYEHQSHGMHLPHDMLLVWSLL